MPFQIKNRPCREIHPLRQSCFTKSSMCFKQFTIMELSETKASSRLAIDNASIDSYNNFKRVKRDDFLKENKDKYSAYKKQF